MDEKDIILIMGQVGLIASLLGYIFGHSQLVVGFVAGMSAALILFWVGIIVYGKPEKRKEKEVKK